MKRSELPDEVFGIPQERKYPMPDKKHTESAIKLFNHVDSKYEEQLAKKVIANMKKYDIDPKMVGKNNRLRKYLPKDMVNEAVFKNEDDIYYNKDKFDSGEINLCFIIGLSGSGKSTMAHGMESSNVEAYEMDDVCHSWNFSDDNFKEYGSLIHTFFQGPGKKYRFLTRQEFDDKYNTEESKTSYFNPLIRDFIKYAIQYAKSHKNTKYVIEGVQIILLNPSDLKNYAVYIKGTSLIVSHIRSAKRDSKRSNNPTKSFVSRITNMKRIKWMLIDNKDLSKWINYYKPLVSVNETSTISEIKNIIFDLGSVLVKCDAIDRIKGAPNIPDDYAQEIIDAWIINNDYTEQCTMDEYIHLVTQRLRPELHRYIPDMLRFTLEGSYPYDYTDKVIDNLKEQGYGVYYLSNWNSWTMEEFKTRARFDFLKKMNGGLFSYECGLMKPDKKIYETFLHQFGLDPSTCIFFDDKKENVEAAKQCGIEAVVFTGPEVLDDFLIKPNPDRELFEEASTMTLEESNKDSVKEYGGPCMGTVVGSGATGHPIPEDSDNVYIVNYKTKNTFTGEEEARLGICKTGMRDLHIKGGKYNRIHKADLEKFKENAYDIKAYRYTGKKKNSFYDVIEDADTDMDFYTLLTGKDLPELEFVGYDDDFVEETAFVDMMDAITSCTEASIRSISNACKDIPVLTENFVGRSYNYYRDMDGVFAVNELTGLRTKSYETTKDIPKAELEIVKYGLVYMPARR
jgi:HAD superfamily hydrolase (TIGR01509 family)